eukprot:TRINITY_DN32584_c0_g1_i1.p1 TRINITY_DN32584_c0_g1~~TRINITY_DN32584_c0_g1_i1.p1  ORF type:complete len:665 (+),score=81.39 TRINITY_DN32584_c0_g1_i1:200-2194(+)
MELSSPRQRSDSASTSEITSSAESALSVASETFPSKYRSRPRNFGFRDACAGLVSCICITASNITAPVVFGLQMGGLSLVMWRHEWFFTCFLFGVLELALLFHMFRNCLPEQAALHGSFQWIVYCWLISAKIAVLYFHILPIRKNADGITLNVSGITAIVCLAPVFYVVVIFRTLKQVLSNSDSFGSARQPDARSQHKSQQSQRDDIRWTGEHGTFAAVLLQDMVWHVVIDMVDIINMLFLANVNEASDFDPLLVQHYPESVRGISAAAGIFIVLGFFFHQQSFPYINFACASMSDESTLFSQSGVSQSIKTGLGSLFDRNGSVGDDRHGNKQMARTGSVRARRQRRHYGVDVVKARKRSAIVSILLVDFPFFGIRTSMYVLSSLQAGDPGGVSASEPSEDPSNLTDSTKLAPYLDLAKYGRIITSPTKRDIVTPSSLVKPPSPPQEGSTRRPQLDKWWVKNLLCLLLQAMQLRFVQQADLEQSQNVQWMDVHRSQASAARSTSRRRKNVQDPALRRAWDEVDLMKRHVHGLEMPPAYLRDESFPENPSISNDEIPEFHNLPMGGAVLHETSNELGSDIGPSEEIIGSQSEEVANSRPRTKRASRSITYYPDRLISSCFARCWSYDISNGIVLHAIMGFVLGWLLAKTDFTQTMTEFIVSKNLD